MTTPFYAPPDAFSDARVVLPPDEARHAVRVLRMREGDAVVVVDGVGGWHEGVLVETARDRAVVEVARVRRSVGEPAREVILALGVLGHRDRFEWAVEKAVELGATGFVPLRTARAAPGAVRAARLDTILLAGLKQSMRSVLPRRYDEMTLGAALDAFPEARPLVAHEAAAGAPGPSEAVQAGEAVLVLIGPEGGFTEPEVETVRARGGTVVTLGPRRLRAETAAAVALSDLMLHASPR